MSFINFHAQKIAREFGTPCYVYSKQALLQNWQEFYTPFKNSGVPFKIHYAVKANSNLAILNILAKLGAGFDVVSGGEIERVLAAGGKATDIVFAGVGKSTAEIERAIALGIYSIHVESTAELQRIDELATQQNKKIGIAIRVNPDVSANTHDYIATGTKDNKFGIDYTKAVDIYQQASKLANIQIKGIACHIGSQITSLEPFLRAIDQLLVIIKQLQQLGIQLEYVDVGGGLGVRYADEQPPTPQAYVDAILSKLQQHNLAIHIEPGRSLVASTGILLTKVEYIKNTPSTNFAIVDAAMNDLIRPALYQSYHDIQQVSAHPQLPAQDYAVVGPICESGDFFALQPKRKLSITSGDLLAILDCGAYGFSMSSNYNSRPRCAEVLVDGNDIYLIRKRETIKELFANEHIVNE